MSRHKRRMRDSLGGKEPGDGISGGSDAPEFMFPGLGVGPREQVLRRHDLPDESQQHDREKELHMRLESTNRAKT